MPRAEVEIRAGEYNFDLDPATTDESKHYRFCAPKNFGRRRAEGYEVVLRESGVRLLNEGPFEGSPDERIYMGEAFLMACPKARYAARRRGIRQRTEARLGSAEEKFEELAKDKGRNAGKKVRVIKDDADEED